MGSYLSIYNNTQDTYYVKVGPDMAAVNIAAIVGSVLSLGVGGGARLLSSKLVAKGIVRVFGVTTSRIAAFAKIAGRALPATAAGWAIGVSVFLAKQLEDQGYVKIPPGEKHEFGPYSLSLWQQAACRRVRINPNNNGEVVTDVVYMRPIFSGATANSVREHNIQYWIDKWGHEERFVIQSDM